MSTPILNMVRQRTRYDCGVASLAMYLGVSYKDALEAFGRGLDGFKERGCFLYEVEGAASRLGVRLERVGSAAYEPTKAEGIVSVGSLYWWHMAVLRRGLLFNTNGQVWEVDRYLEGCADEEPRFGALLVRAGRL